MHDVSLIIPAKKEPNALPMVLEEINKIKLSCEIIIIIEKSDVETYKVAKKFNCKIIFQSGRGYGNAIIEGVMASNTKYSCIFYADGSTDLDNNTSVEASLAGAVATISIGKAF